MDTNSIEPNKFLSEYNDSYAINLNLFDPFDKFALL